MTGSDDAATAPRLDPTERRLRRFRILVDDNLALVVTVLVLVALLGGYVTYATHVAPGTTTETREVSDWESSGEFSHRATVVNGTDAFERGAVLRNRSVYFQRVAPTLDGRFAYEYAASDGGSLTVTVETVAVIRSVSAFEGDRRAEHWRVEEPLNRDRVDSVAPGERVTVPFSVNVSAVSERARRIERQLGASPGQTEVTVTSRVTVSGTRNGQSVEETRRYHLPIEPGVGVYHVEEPDPDALTDDGGTPEQVSVQRSYGPVRELGAPLLFVAGVGGLAAIAVGRRRDALAVSQTDRERLAAAATREQFDDWITRARVPATARVDPPVPVDSLEGLVDVAIDTDARVVEDRDRGEFVVLGDAVTYVYRPANPRIGGVGTTDLDPLSYSDESPSSGGLTSAEVTTDVRENGETTAPSGNGTEHSSSGTGATPDEPESGAPANPAPDDGVSEGPIAGEYGTGPPTDLIPADRATGAEVDPSPDTDAPNTDAPDTDALDTDAPDTDAPNTDAPDTDASDTDAPDPSPDDSPSAQSADGAASDRSTAAADGTLETVPVPSLAVDDHPAIYHENDGADADGWPDDRNLARRSPSDD
ncbi:hypothetical protein SAMN05216559_4064 [Halomicrobium zhouii]|uniref:DUF5305 domain-containing protein n=1 Tax=Halomicrobium zhouii TaxID=767519 RepID=A0A1I6M9K1_9EURY|nr:DUF5305 domain-containing protein [Halomicrobium zhouii]SFS12298.1 hypothetical protein SAMN05216559_4064 [Halomicrobium zhouii]